MKFLGQLILKSLEVIGTIWGILGIGLLSLSKDNSFIFKIIVAILVIGYIFLIAYFIWRNRHIEMPEKIDGVVINTYPMLTKKINYNTQLALSNIQVVVRFDGTALNVDYEYKGTVNSLRLAKGLYMTLVSEANMQNERNYSAYDENGNLLEISDVAPKGMVRSMCINFLSKKKYGDDFHIRLVGKTDNTVPISGKSYYFVKPSFRKVKAFQTVRYSFTMISKEEFKSVKCYSVNAQGEDYIRACKIFQTSDGYVIQDTTDNMGFNTIRLYIFER